MQCRVGCGACCIALSISSPIPGMPAGKPAGIACLQLDRNKGCKLYGSPERPAVCERLRPARDICGDSADQAMGLIGALELATNPG